METSRKAIARELVGIAKVLTAGVDESAGAVGEVMRAKREVVNALSKVDWWSTRLGDDCKDVDGWTNKDFMSERTAPRDFRNLADVLRDEAKRTEQMAKVLSDLTEKLARALEGLANVLER